ncbi:unnamed protein product, partial [Dicrocoelium dendriticum]
DPCGSFPYTSASLGGYLPKPFLVASRVVLYTKSRIFVCGPATNLLPSVGQRKRCYSSEDNGFAEWHDLGPIVSQVLTYLPSAGLLFGIGSDEKSLLMSRDFGKTWEGINMFEYERHVAGSSDSINSTTAPTSVLKSTFDSTNFIGACSANLSNGWYACYKGVYKENVQRVDWSSSCETIQPFP